MIPDKLFVPSKTDSEKLQSLDSCIESCIKIIRQELIKRAESTEDPEVHMPLANAVDCLNDFQAYYNLIKNR
jgi:hypothetical protein